MFAHSFSHRSGLALAATLMAFGAHAFTPGVEIVAPTGTQYVDQFPSAVNVTLNLSVYNPSGGCVTNGIKALTVAAQHTDDPDSTLIHTSASNPINNASQLCPAPYSFVWNVPKPGSYSLVVTATHGNDDGTENAVVEFLALAVEHPAPPAVANTYINATPIYKSTSGKKRGCVISKIAENHAKESKYGDKGGPYDLSSIKADVDELYGNGTCPVK